MEIKVNKEIRKYQESLFFGLSIRQFICSLLAVSVAVGIYFLLRLPLGEETVSWVCILAAAPIAAAGFFNYNGLNLERFLWAWIKSEFLCAGRRKFVAVNYYQLILEEQNKPKPRSEKIVLFLRGQLTKALKIVKKGKTIKPEHTE